MKPNFPFLLLCVAVIILSSYGHCLFAQSAADANGGSRLEFDPSHAIWRFKYWGATGHSYFIQHSEDLAHWEWLPAVQPGNDAVNQLDFSPDAARFFLRLHYTDQPSLDPETDDFDSDEVPNLSEVTQGTNPLAWKDDDGDGLPDDWEKFYFGNLGFDGTGNPDGDAWNNLSEYLGGTHPQLSDSDGNGVGDGTGITVFSYDLVGRILADDRNGSTQTYAYDDASNVLRRE